MLVIKNYIIDTDKVHAKIQENKEKPKKTSKPKKVYKSSIKKRK